MDRFLLEAMREVDAMLPNSPPIAPPMRGHEIMAEAETAVTMARQAYSRAIAADYQNQRPSAEYWAGMANAADGVWRFP